MNNNTKPQHNEKENTMKDTNPDDEFYNDPAVRYLLSSTAPDEVEDLADVLAYQDWSLKRIRARKASGLSAFAWSIMEEAIDSKGKGQTEDEALESIRTSFLDQPKLRAGDTPDSIDLETCDKTTLSDIETAIAEVKQTGRWAWHFAPPPWADATG